MKKFHWSSYWHCWSRVLTNNSHEPGCSFVEVNLTPVNGNNARSLKAGYENQVKLIRIRAHGTLRGPNDKETNELPDEALAEMKEYVGEDLTARLINEDFLSQIDWRLYNKFNNGGANLGDIKKR